jgi:two-component SAPR family response regulator
LRGGKRSVVLVDDDKGILTILKSKLEESNYEVHDFDNPLEALQYMRSMNSPHLLITDIRMPAMTGFDLAKQVNKDHPDMRIILLTSFEIHRSEFEKIFPSTKIDALVIKPVCIEKLIDAVNALMVSNISELT